MVQFGPKVSKAESPEKTPYTIHYSHTSPVESRVWTGDFYQFVSIDPGRKNYAFRIERRYKNGTITPVVYIKVALEEILSSDHVCINKTYVNLTNFLEEYSEFYPECHYVIIERQLPHNYKASRIAQHTITYFLTKLHNMPLLPSILEIDSKLKGKMLGAPKNISDQQLKSWAVGVARNFLTERGDQYSLDVLDFYKKKQDDLSDTVCQIHALLECWGVDHTSPFIDITRELNPVVIKKPTLKAEVKKEVVPKTGEEIEIRRKPVIRLNTGGVKTPTLLDIVGRVK